MQLQVDHIGFKLEQVIHEDRKPSTLYSIRFCESLPSYWSHFATVGGNCASVYHIDFNIQQEHPQHQLEHIRCLQAFVDEDIEEDYYCCCWCANSDGNPLLVVAGFRGILKIINCLSFEVDSALLGHGNSVNDVRVHPINDSLVFSASKDDSIRMWNVHTSVCLAIFAGDQGHKQSVLSIDIHPLGNCFLSTGIDNCVKVWKLTGPGLLAAIEKSFNVVDGAELHSVSASSGSLSANPQAIADSQSSIWSRNRHFSPITDQFPLFSTNQVHRDYVDSARWVGNLIASKSTKNRIALWAPDSHRYKGAPLIVREFAVKDCDLWFVRLDVCIPLDLVAVGNRVGKVFIYSLSGEHHPDITARYFGTSPESSAPSLPTKTTAKVTRSRSSGSATSAASSISAGSADSSTSGSASVSENHISSSQSLSKVADLSEEFAASTAPNAIVEHFTCGATKPAIILSHPRCNTTVRQVTFSPSGSHLTYCCEDGSVWVWSIEVLS